MIRLRFESLWVVNKALEYHYIKHLCWIWITRCIWIGQILWASKGPLNASFKSSSATSRQCRVFHLLEHNRSINLRPSMLVKRLPNRYSWCHRIYPQNAFRKGVINKVLSYTPRIWYSKLKVPIYHRWSVDQVMTKRRIELRRTWIILCDLLTACNLIKGQLHMRTPTWTDHRLIVEKLLSDPRGNAVHK